LRGAAECGHSSAAVLHAFQACIEGEVHHEQAD
jgi:hypothetical protein